MISEVIFTFKAKKELFRQLPAWQPLPADLIQYFYRYVFILKKMRRLPTDN